MCVCVCSRSARPEISLSITNDEWPEKWTYEFVKWHHTHMHTIALSLSLFSRTGCTIPMWVHIYWSFATGINTSSVFICLFIACHTSDYCECDMVAIIIHTNTFSLTHTHMHTHASSAKSSIILYYLLGPSSCGHTTPFWIIYMVIVSGLDLHLIKCIINNSIANSTYAQPLTNTNDQHKYSAKFRLKSQGSSLPHHIGSCRSVFFLLQFGFESIFISQIDCHDIFSTATNWSFELDQY